MGKRQEAALETRQRIIDAMRSLLQEKDAASIGIEEITARAGVAKGSFYTYFRRKEDLVSVIAMDCYNIVKETVFSSSGSVYDQICAYLKDSVKIIKKHTLQIAQGWMKSVSAPLAGEQGGVEKYRFDFENIMSMIKRAVSVGELRDDTPCEEITRGIMNSYYGAVIIWCITSGECELIGSIDAYCEYELKPVLENYKTGK